MVQLQCTPVLAAEVYHRDANALCHLYPISAPSHHNVGLVGIVLDIVLTHPFLIEAGRCRWDSLSTLCRNTRHH